MAVSVILPLHNRILHDEWNKTDGVAASVMVTAVLTPFGQSHARHRTAKLACSRQLRALIRRNLGYRRIFICDVFRI